MSDSSIGDQVEEAYKQARDDVYYYLLTLGLTPGEAQDTAQEVFLKLYTALRGGEAIQNHRAWIFRVAHNHGLNIRTRRREMQPVDGLPLRSADDPERSAIQHQQHRKLQEALATLSPQQRQCLQLRAEGLKFHEISAAIGITASTVNEYVRRGLAKLKRAVNE